MTNTAVAADFHQTFDVQLGFGTQIAFNQSQSSFLTDCVDLFVSQIFNTDIFADSAFLQNGLRCGAADSVDIS